MPHVYFASPSQFDDPNDCNNPPAFEAKTNREWIEYLTRWQIGNPSEIREIERDLFFNRDRVIAEKKRTWRADLVSTTGVVCLCPSSTNEHLWKNYASNHAGFCVGIESGFFLQLHRTSLIPGSQPIVDGVKVEYVPVLPKLNPFVEHDDDREWFLQQYRYKEAKWKQEDEYRMVMIGNRLLSNADRLVRIPAQFLKEVVVGHSCSPHVFEEIKVIVEQQREHGSRIEFRNEIRE